MLANKSFENAPRNRLQVTGSDGYKLFHVHDKIKSRLNLRTTCYFSIENNFSLPFLSKSLKYLRKL